MGDLPVDDHLVEEAEQLLSFAIGLQVQEDYKQGKSGRTSRRQENQDFKQSSKGFEKERIRGDGRLLLNQEAKANKKTEKGKVDQEKKSEIVKKEDMLTKENFKKKDIMLSKETFDMKMQAMEEDLVLKQENLDIIVI